MVMTKVNYPVPRAQGVKEAKDMGCAYSDIEVEKWEDVSNPIGEACSNCFNCECEHWAGICPEDCEFLGGQECPGKWEGADLWRDPMSESSGR